VERAAAPRVGRDLDRRPLSIPFGSPSGSGRTRRAPRAERARLRRRVRRGGWPKSAT
jgi:hypothetical protein